MFGGRSIHLARVFGIRIGVDFSWFFILFFFIWLLSDSYKEFFPDSEAFVLATVSALLFFASVVLHELGHALVAMRNGVEIAGIDLWMFGGVAKAKSDFPSAGVEFRVAIAGPLVTLVIAGLCFGGAVVAGGSSAIEEAVFVEEGAKLGAAEAVLGWLGAINLLLFLFNLIPGFPLDGGRIARAIAWWRSGSRTRATRFAAALGRGFAYLIGGFGIFLAIQGALVSGLWLVFIAIFLSQAARQAEFQTAVSARIEGVRVADVMDAEPVAVEEHTTLDRVHDEFFLRYGWPWFPVVDATGRLTGVIARDRIEGIADHLRRETTVSEVMGHDAASDFRVGVDEPLESLLGAEGLRRLGAMIAVDGEGRLRGIVTIDQVRRALQPPSPAV